MFSFRWVDADQATTLSRQGLDQLEPILARDELDVIAAGNRGRDTVRVALSTPSGTESLYIKRERRIAFKDLVRHLFFFGGWWTKARSEFRVLQRLQEFGMVDSPRPVACLQQGLIRPRGCLVLEDLGDVQPLPQFLASGMCQTDGAERARFFRLLGRQIAMLHDSGVTQPDLYANHILVAPSGDEWRYAFIDFQRSRITRALSMKQRTRDLAALMATLSERLVDQHERSVLLDRYLEISGLVDEGLQLRSGIQKRVASLLHRRKVWEIREADAIEQRDIAHVQTENGERLWVDREYLPALEKANLTTFRQVMETTQGTCLRTLKDRENWKLELHGPHQQPRAAYLKKHHVRDAGSWLRAKFGAQSITTAGAVEARNVERLRRAGIPAMQVIAYGEKLHPTGLSESFVLTDDLAGYSQLDDFLQERFSVRHTGRRNQESVDLRTLLYDVAVVARRFHTLGYNHRDFYCCHFFIRELQPSNFEVNLIDLQRVEHRRRFRHRWVVKDLAQLSYSAPAEYISWTDQMAFIKRYLGVTRLRPADKRLIRAVLSKRRRMQRNLGPHPNTVPQEPVTTTINS